MEQSRRGPRVLVVGEHRQTVTVVRSLSRAGHRVTLGCPEAQCPTRLSRHVERTWLYDWRRRDLFVAQLERFLAEEPHEFVFIVGESPLRQLIRAPGGVAARAALAHPDPATIARCFDKSALYDLAPRLGIPTPPTFRYSHAAAWRAAARAMGFPVVVKRADSSARVQGRKALVCRGPGDLDAALEAAARDADAASLVLQKFQRGIRHNCHVACDRGRIVAYFQQKVLATDELDDTGIGTAGISVPPSPLLRAYCERLTAALGYHGIGCIQFLVDEAAGACGFLEFNARMDSTAALPYRLGYDYPRLAVELAARGERGRAFPELKRRYAPGARYHWLLGDLRAWITASRARSLSRPQLALWALRMAWRALASHHLTFEWRDPRPTLAMFWQEFGKRAWKRLHASMRPVGAGD